MLRFHVFYGNNCNVIIFFLRILDPTLLLLLLCTLKRLQCFSCEAAEEKLEDPFGIIFNVNQVNSLKQISSTIFDSTKDDKIQIQVGLVLGGDGVVSNGDVLILFFE